MNRNRIKLLVTLVLVTLAATSAWMTSQADARGHKSPGASSHFVTHPGTAVVFGDPDGGAGHTPPPPPSLKQARQVVEGEDSGRTSPTEWVRWTSRIWATLYLKFLR